MSEYKIISRCLACDGEKLRLFLDLGDQPLANDYEGTGKKFPLRVMVCETCFHNQLILAINPDLMFKNYLYVSGTTQTLKEHFYGLAEKAIKTWQDPKAPYAPYAPRVLDIGANDGSLLEHFANWGCPVLGVDPAKNLVPLCIEKGIPMITNYWNVDTVINYPSVFEKKFDVITALNVLGHNDNPYDFLMACKLALNKNGLIIVEFPYSLNILTQGQFDQFYFEHVNEFNISSMVCLVTRLDLCIDDIDLIPVHGGSIRFYIKNITDAKRNPDTFTKITDLIKLERAAGVWGLQSYESFQKRIDDQLDSLKSRLDYWNDRRVIPVLYGAAAKSSTLFNYRKDIGVDYAVDDNPLKIGKTIPGTDIPINGTDALADDDRNLCILVGAWNFFDEILQKIKKLRTHHKNVVVRYIPYVQEFHI